MVVYIGPGRPLTFKQLVSSGLAGVSINPFSYGAEAGDLAVIVAAGDQAFNRITAAQPAPAGWTQPTYLVGGVTGFDGGGGEINYLYKRLTDDDNISVSILTATSGVMFFWMLLYIGGRRPPATHAGLAQQGMFVGAVPDITVASVNSAPPTIVVQGGISEGGQGSNPAGLIRNTATLSQSSAWINYGLIGATELPGSYSFTCPSATNFGGHAGFYIEA